MQDASIAIGHTGRLSAIALSAPSADGSVWLATGAEDGGLLVYKLGDEKYVAAGNPNKVVAFGDCGFRAHCEGSVSCLHWLDSTLVASGSEGQVVGFDVASIIKATER